MLYESLVEFVCQDMEVSTALNKAVVDRPFEGPATKKAVMVLSDFHYHIQVYHVIKTTVFGDPNCIRRWKQSYLYRETLYESRK